MIRRLFKTKRLGILVLGAFLLTGVLGVNSLNAQTNSSMAAQEFTEEEKQELKNDLQALIETTEEDPNISEPNREVTLEYYDNFRKKVSELKSVPGACRAAIPPTKDFAGENYPAHTVDLEQLAEDTRNALM